MNNKVSIIVPIYGVENYIAQCLHSLFRQTFQYIQYVFVDDCTKDNSIAILEKIIEEYPNRKENITIIRKRKNEGLPAARKTGLKHASGDYIIHIDSDDWIEYGMIEAMYNKVISDNFDIVWCDYYEDYSTQSKYIDTSVNSIDKTTILKRLLNINKPLHSGVWNKLVKREIYFDNNIIFPNANQMEDFVVTTQTIYYAKKFGYLNRALYHYRINQDSLCRDPRRMNKIILESYENFLMSTTFLLNKMGKNIIALEPELSNYTNYIKLTIMLSPETRDVKKLSELYPESNESIFNKDFKSPFYHKIFLLGATKNISFYFFVIDNIRSLKNKFNGIRIK